MNPTPHLNVVCDVILTYETYPYRDPYYITDVFTYLRNVLMMVRGILHESEGEMDREVAWSLAAH